MDLRVALGIAIIVVIALLAIGMVMTVALKQNQDLDNFERRKQLPDLWGDNHEVFKGRIARKRILDQLDATAMSVENVSEVRSAIIENAIAVWWISTARRVQGTSGQMLVSLLDQARIDEDNIPYAS